MTDSRIFTHALTIGFMITIAIGTTSLAVMAQPSLF